jgi:poly-gamma-glutamate capsule biosynthesis protein CapA/YwtB (metallophosphatase superfamily)
MHMAGRSALRARLLAAAGLATIFSIGMVGQPQSALISITLTGQSMIRSDIRARTPDVVSTWARLLKADVVFTNFESTVVEKGESLAAGRFLTPPEALDALAAMGFNLLSLANNHAFDLKVPGIHHALDETNRRHIVHAGTGDTIDEASAPAYLKTPKGTVALVAIASGLVAEGGSATSARPGVNELRVDKGTPNAEDAQRILASIRVASTKADLVIVYEHNHVFGDVPFTTMMIEELPERLRPAEWLKKWTHAEIDAGADIIVMHGAPLVHGVEIYRGRPIFFDLGNFIFQYPPSLVSLDEPIIWESVVASVEIRGKALQSIKFRPIAINKLGQGQPDVRDEHANNVFLQTRGLPALATGDQARFILERLADSSLPFGTTVVVKGEAAEIRLKGGN